MNEIINKKRGESLSFAFILNAEYNMARIELSKAFIGAHSFDLVVNDHALQCRLTSTQTQAIYGKNELVLHLDDSVLGIVKISAGVVNLSATLDGLNNSSINTGLDFTVPITINEATIEVGDLLFNYVKGDKGDTPYIVANYWWISGVNTGVKALGIDGEDGKGIQSITLLSTVGLVKTYRILFTDATTFDYTVTDGLDGKTTYTTTHRDDLSAQTDGLVSSFTLSHTPMDLASCQVFLNGSERTISQLVGNVITLDFAPVITADFVAVYRVNTTDIPNLENKVDKEAGKGLSTNDYTTTEKNKLANVADGAEVNVQSDWTATSGDAFILNKPNIPTQPSDIGAAPALGSDDNYITDAEKSALHTHSNKSILDAIQESFTTALKSAYDGVVSWITTNGTNILTHIGLTSGNPHNVTKTDVGLSNVDNTSDVNKPVSTAQATAIGLKQDSLGYTPENSANKQNNLTTDGTGTKFPTVDAVNSGIANRNLKAANLSDVANKATARTNLEVYSKAEVDNSFSPKIASTTVTTNTVIDGTFTHIVSNGTSLSHQLPTAATYPNKEWSIYNENATDLTLVGTISGDSSITLQEGESLTFYSNGTNLIVK
jgi:hypothetical protein